MKRLVVPDTHGEKADWDAIECLKRDVRRLGLFDEIVLLGDHVDAGGIFSRFSPIGEGDVSSSNADFGATKALLRFLRRHTRRNGAVYYIEGNHEFRVEQWLLETIRSPEERRLAASALSVEARLGLADLGVTYIRSHSTYAPAMVPGVLLLDGAAYLHGFTSAKHATANHLEKANMSVRHGHTHRRQEASRGMLDGTHQTGYCFGTLSELQPLYAHSRPTDWAHGYGLEFYEGGKLYTHSIQIINGQSRLP